MDIQISLLKHPLLVLISLDVYYKMVDVILSLLFLKIKWVLDLPLLGTLLLKQMILMDGLKKYALFVLMVQMISNLKNGESLRL